MSKNETDSPGRGDDRISHECDESAADEVILNPGDACPFCDERVGEIATDGGVIYVAGRSDGGGGGRKAHTDPDCPALSKARTIIERDRDAYPDELDVCQWCTGQVAQPDTQDTSHYLALKRAAEGGRR